MKKIILALLTSIFVLLWIQYSFSKNREAAEPQPAAFIPINKWYTSQADSLLLQLLVLEKLHNGSYKRPIFEKQFIKVRAAFKKMEFLMGYFDFQVYNGLNTKIKAEVELSKGVYEYVAQPHGLQVMEQTLEDDATFKIHKATLKTEISMAITTVRFLKNHHFTKPYTDTGFLQAVKQATLTIAALGISGFDKPVLEDAISETKQVLAGMEEVLLIYKKNNPLVTDATSLLNQTKLAKRFIINSTTDFDRFDRLTFIRTYLQPMLATADKILKHDLLKSQDAKVYRSFFQKDYVDQLYHRTKTYPVEMVALGKALFQSNTLSVNEQISCATCHKPELDFADTVQRNAGFAFVDTAARNTPTLINSTYHIRFQRDGHALFMQDQFREVLSSHIEMGNFSDTKLMIRIKADTALDQPFFAAYGTQKDSITYQQMLDALEAFVRSLTNLHTQFDQYMTYQTKTISPSVKRGFNLFMGSGKCGTCHFMPVFNGTILPYALKEDNEVIGALETDDFDNPVLSKDLGLFATTKLPLHKNAFKVPTVRNLKKTAPYMHNGALKTLDDVLLFYNVGGGGGWGLDLDVPNQSLQREPIRLSIPERDDIIAFLHSLN